MKKASERLKIPPCIAALINQCKHYDQYILRESDLKSLTNILETVSESLVKSWLEGQSQGIIAKIMEIRKMIKSKSISTIKDLLRVIRPRMIRSAVPVSRQDLTYKPNTLITIVVNQKSRTDIDSLINKIREIWSSVRDNQYISVQSVDGGEIRTLIL